MDKAAQLSRCPALLARCLVHPESTRRWKHSRGQDERRTCGRLVALCAAHLTLFSEVVGKVSSIVGVSSTIYQSLFRIELSELGIAWTLLSSTWTKNFLRGHGISLKQPVKDAREAHTGEVAEVNLCKISRISGANSRGSL